VRSTGKEQPQVKTKALELQETVAYGQFKLQHITVS